MPEEGEGVGKRRGGLREKGGGGGRGEGEGEGGKREGINLR